MSANTSSTTATEESSGTPVITPVPQLCVLGCLQNPVGPALKKLISEQLAFADWPVVML
jgi:hypothetical protein